MMAAPQVYVMLPRLTLNDFIFCPGCYRVFDFAEKCARHLIESCVRIRDDNENKERRRDLIKWLANFHETCSCVNIAAVDSYKINMLLTDCSYSTTKRARLEINLPEIPICMRCPICDVYFHSIEKCSDHLFRECLYVESAKDARRVQIWLSEFFHTYNSKTFMNDLLLDHQSPVICKYCNAEAPTEHVLMQHCKLYHTDSIYIEQAVCYVCNFSALTNDKLVKHIISKHIRCHHCSRSKMNDFFTFKFHIKTCPGNKVMTIKCPICLLSISLDLQTSFENHILSCKRNVDLKFDDERLYITCDICLLPVLILDVNTHLKEHLGRGDRCSNRQKRLTVNLKDIRKYLDDQEFAELSK